MPSSGKINSPHPANDEAAIYGSVVKQLLISSCLLFSGIMVIGQEEQVALAQTQLPQGPVCSVDAERGVHCLSFDRSSWGEVEEPAAYSVAVNTDYERFVAMGRSRFDEGDLTGAIAFYTEAINSNQQLADAYGLRGTAYLSSNNPQLAIADYDQAIGLGTGDARTDAANHLGRGLSHQRAGNSQEAITDATTAIMLNPSFAAAYSLRGQARGILEDISGACEDWQVAANLYWDAQQFDRYSDTLDYIRAGNC